MVSGSYLVFLNSMITVPDSKDWQVWYWPMGTWMAGESLPGTRR